MQRANCKSWFQIWPSKVHFSLPSQELLLLCHYLASSANSAHSFTTARSVPRMCTVDRAVISRKSRYVKGILKLKKDNFGLPLAWHMCPDIDNIIKGVTPAVQSNFFYTSPVVRDDRLSIWANRVKLWWFYLIFIRMKMEHGLEARHHNFCIRRKISFSSRYLYD